LLLKFNTKHSNPYFIRCNWLAW